MCILWCVISLSSFIFVDRFSFLFSGTVLISAFQTLYTRSVFWIITELVFTDASFYHSISVDWGTGSSSNLSKVTHEWLTRIHTPELSWFLNPLLWALYHTIFQVSVLTSCKFILRHDSLKWKWAIFSDSPSTHTS